MKIRHAYRDAGDHLAYRNLSIYEPDPRDLAPDGTLPGFLASPTIALEDGEIEFDHEPSEAELAAAFPGHAARAKKAKAIAPGFPPAFYRILPPTLAQEAPYPSNWGNPRNFSNDPGDPGGKTMDGIIQAEYDRWRVNHGELRQDVRQCTEDEGDQIYFHEYYLPYCPELPAGLDQCFFDAAANEGPGQAIKLLQFALSIHSDGKWGPQTDAAVKAIKDVPATIRAFHARRRVVYEETRGFTRFGADWERRNDEIEAASLAQAAPAAV